MLSGCAFRRGLLSADQVAAVATRRPWWTDAAEMCDLAERMTVRQIRRMVNRYPFGEYARPGATDEAEPEPAPQPA